MCVRVVLVIAGAHSVDPTPLVERYIGIRLKLEILPLIFGFFPVQWVRTRWALIRHLWCAQGAYG